MGWVGQKKETKNFNMVDTFSPYKNEYRNLKPAETTKIKGPR
jgi:hypothetical protein